MRNYSDVQTDFYAAFQDLARQCEGHGQIFRTWFALVVSHFGLSNLDVALAGFKIMVHTDLSFSKDIDLVRRFIEFMTTLKRIDNLEKELETLRERGIRPDLQVVTA